MRSQTGGCLADWPTLVCGGPGCGKTLFGVEFLVRGATQFHEPGVCLSFEESGEDLASNVRSLGFDLKSLIARKRLAIDHIFLDRSLIEEAGEYDLEALFIRLGHAVDSIGANRVLLDSVEALFAGLKDEAVLRSELRRLFRWLKDRNLTAVITAERGQGSLTRHGLEEYLSDCVILLDHRVTETVLTRRLRVVKYRGSTHGTGEYPFLIEENGLSVLPVTSADLRYTSSEERASTGIGALDAMLGGKGYFRGSSILVSGAAGTGKTSLTAHFLNSACSRGERCVFLSFEESPGQITRNMRSIGVDLKQWADKGLLQFHSTRPTTLGLESHLVRIHKIVEEFKPAIVALDPVTSLLHSGTSFETRSMLLRLVHFLKERQVTALMTTLSGGPDSLEQSGAEISSLVDTWLLLRDMEIAGERNRGLYILKARGIAHSNQIREFLMTSRGIELREVYLGDAGLLTGSARLSQEARDVSAALLARQEVERKRLLLDRRRKSLESQIAALQLDLETEEKEAAQLSEHEAGRLRKLQQDRTDMGTSRSAGDMPAPANGRVGNARGGRK